MAAGAPPYLLFLIFLAPAFPPLQLFPVDFFPCPVLEFRPNYSPDFSPSFFFSDPVLLCFPVTFPSTFLYSLLDLQHSFFRPCFFRPLSSPCPSIFLRRCLVNPSPVLFSLLLTPLESSQPACAFFLPSLRRRTVICRPPASSPKWKGPSFQRLFRMPWTARHRCVP